MSGKKLPPPSSGTSLSEALRSRHAASDDASRAVAEEPRATQPAKPKTKMVRRSWYLPEETANSLAELVDELHFETRQPKHAVLDALLQAAIAQREPVTSTLNAQQGK